jgi:DnaJ-class molecular chaperone
MTDDRQALQVNWNRPPGNVSTRCPECLGHGSVVVEQCYSGAHRTASLSVPVECGGCGGAGTFPGMQPPV